MLERWLAFLAEAGYRIAVFKHSHHPLAGHVPGKDSARLIPLAAAGGIAGQGGFQWFGEEPAWMEFVLWLADRGSFDLVLVEGGKSAPFPKIEVVRGAERLVPDALAVIGEGGMDFDAPGQWTEWLIQNEWLRPR